MVSVFPPGEWKINRDPRDTLMARFYLSPPALQLMKVHGEYGESLFYFVYFGKGGERFEDGQRYTLKELYRFFEISGPPVSEELRERLEQE